MSAHEMITVAALLAVGLLLCTVGIADRRRRHRPGRHRSGARSAMGGVLGTFDDAFRPEAARAAEIREVQRELPAEASVPGEPPFPANRITIEVRRRGRYRVDPR